MKVRFDLRPAEFLERERKRHSFSAVRLLAVALLLSFVASSGFYIVMAFLETRMLQSDIPMSDFFKRRPTTAARAGRGRIPFSSRTYQRL